MKSLLMLMAAPLLIGATEPVRLQPAGKWVLDYGEKSCSLMRVFGDPKKPTTLALERSGLDSSFSLVIVGDALRRAEAATDVVLRFLPVDGLVQTRGLGASSTGTRQPAVMFAQVHFAPEDVEDYRAERTKRQLTAAMRKAAERPEPRDLAKEKARLAEAAANAEKTTQIRVELGSKHLLMLETGSLGRPFTLMRECLQDLERSWGLDPDVQDKIVYPAARKTQGSWFTDEDYPRSSLMRGEESVIKARLMIDTEGKITNCTSLTHFDAPEFPEAVCRALTKRGSFYPAQLADGTKVPTYYTMTVRFQIPR